MDESEAARRRFQIMMNVQTANVLAMRGIVTCLAAGLEPIEERVERAIRPLLSGDPAAKAFASDVLAAASDIMTSATMLAGTHSRRPPRPR